MEDPTDPNEDGVGSDTEAAEDADLDGTAVPVIADREGRECDERRPDGESGRSSVAVFGKTMKMLRERAGLDREELGGRIGYAPSTVASFEQGRRIPLPETVDRADHAVHAKGLLSVWKEELEKAQYPAFFQGMALLEKEAIELLAFDTLVVKGLLQTEEYTRALLAMRRPGLDPETIEQRVTARLARQAIFDRRPAPLLSFVLDESILRRPFGGTSVLRGQLEHLLQVGRKSNVELQVMPLSRVENAGVNGSFTVVTRKDGKRFVYAEADGIGSLQTGPKQVARAAARYGIIRSQALTRRESLEFVEGVLGSL